MTDFEKNVEFCTGISWFLAGQNYIFLQSKTGKSLYGELYAQ